MFPRCPLSRSKPDCESLVARCVHNRVFGDSGLRARANRQNFWQGVYSGKSLRLGVALYRNRKSGFNVTSPESSKGYGSLWLEWRGGVPAGSGHTRRLLGWR
jgi:hypothetical protein